MVKDASANVRVALEVEAGASEEFYLSRLEGAKASAGTDALRSHSRRGPLISTERRLACTTS